MRPCYYTQFLRNGSESSEKNLCGKTTLYSEEDERGREWLLQKDISNKHESYHLLSLVTLQNLNLSLWRFTGEDKGFSTCCHENTDYICLFSISSFRFLTSVLLIVTKE